MPLTFDGQTMVSLNGIKFRATDPQDNLILFDLPRQMLFDRFHAKSQADFPEIYRKHQAVIHKAAERVFTARRSVVFPLALTDADFS
ncbi:MAG: hypothetical protein AB7I36_11315 [Rhodospirillaceae bacterium]